MRLIEDLLRGYNPMARPVKNSSEAVVIACQLQIRSLLELSWVDEFLNWNPDDYGGLDRVSLPISRIWNSDFGIRNSAGKFYGDLEQWQSFAEVTNTGFVNRYIPSKIETSCSLDMQYFPFDQQACYIHIDPWDYGSKQVDLTIDDSGSIYTNETPSGQWVFAGSSAEVIEMPYLDFSYKSIKFTLQLSRKPEYYMLTLICPSLMVSVLEILMFLLPPESGEKISLGITGLLSFSVSLLMIADNLPPQSDKVPLLTVYILCIMSLMILSIGTSVFVLIMHHPKRLPPKWMTTKILKTEMTS
ncbi:hypothetical protein CAPTEDRAFT_204661 [Capitella teleta]|uniref:Neurotransmitter-gated ion-channel ligand-binding domain-containing protein n=1 Tax=Capitella teleta TaxID=283909 RepID=R7UTW3_CAPTE|nr:hypothetical protein CAPTEDRAFT_204661 [Capitella teleta]|eukprot:ELU07377.1 hypothetical protein CAPTEDRAFT_204661 [Capitella teleta]